MYQVGVTALPAVARQSRAGCLTELCPQPVTAAAWFHKRRLTLRSQKKGPKIPELVKTAKSSDLSDHPHAHTQALGKCNAMDPDNECKAIGRQLAAPGSTREGPGSRGGGGDPACSTGVLETAQNTCANVLSRVPRAAGPGPAGPHKGSHLPSVANAERRFTAHLAQLARAAGGTPSARVPDRGALSSPKATLGRALIHLDGVARNYRPTVSLFLPKVLEPLRPSESLVGATPRPFLPGGGSSWTAPWPRPLPPRPPPTSQLRGLYLKSAPCPPSNLPAEFRMNAKVLRKLPATAPSLTSPAGLLWECSAPLPWGLCTGGSCHACCRSDGSPWLQGRLQAPQ